MQKLFWIDAVKALCMISVYLVHSEVYYSVRCTLQLLAYPFLRQCFFLH